MDRAAALARIDAVNAAGKYHADWESLSQWKVPDWYADTRFGIFLHWGVFSVPAYNDWYARNMYMQGSPEYEYHLKHYGPHRQFGWKDFVPLFTMEKFDPDAWAELFAEAGADYIVPVAEHHDGFQNYKSELSHWNAAEMGPHRDILGDLLDAAERHGLTRGTSSHAIEHWWFLSHAREFDSDLHGEYEAGDLYWPSRREPASHHDLFDPTGPDREFMDDWLLRTCELVDRYHPRILYFDWWIEQAAAREHLKRFAAYYYNVMEDRGGCVINYKLDAFPFGCAVPDLERGGFSGAVPFLWQSDTSVMRNSWCRCTAQEAQYKEPAELIQTLCDVVSKNGRLLLNFGPSSDGTLAPHEIGILKAIAGWMKVNGECIRGAGLWRTQVEGPTGMDNGQFSDGKAVPYTAKDFRFTCRGDDIYAVCMKCPEDGKLSVVSLADADATHLPLFHGIIGDVSVLGLDRKVEWKRDPEGLHVDLGGYRSDLPVVLKVHCL